MITASKEDFGKKNIPDFMYYCKHYAYGYRRKRPLHDETLGRYMRGIRLAEKIVGHSLETVSEDDQLLLLEKLPEYKQGTRKVTIEIVQRYIAYLIRKGRYDGPNLLRGREVEIIGEWEPVRKPRIKSTHQIRIFMNRIITPELRIICGLMYYGGLTAEEIASLKTEAITDKGVVVWRRVRQEMQHLPLPPRFMTELYAFVDGKERVFSFSETDRARASVVNAFRLAQREANLYHDMTINDFRKTAIKHFYDECYDLELTKRFAGVDAKKRGWLDSLQDESSTYMETIAKGRHYYGKTTKLGTVER